MTINNINQSVYESDDVVAGYKSINLQPPEIVIFYNYKDAIYNKSVLDIGCGTGRTTHYLSKFTNHYRAIDYSQGMVNTCRRSYPNVYVTQNDVRDLSDVEDNSFDTVVFSYNGIDYLDHESRIQGLKEIHRVLKDDGLFIFSTHNRDNLKSIPRPQLEFTPNPLSLLRNIRGYMFARANYKRNTAMQSECNEFQIIIDPSDNFQLLTYYISIEKQVEQLQHHGLKVIEMYDLDGNTIPASASNDSSCWIYYVTRKQ